MKAPPDWDKRVERLIDILTDLDEHERPKCGEDELGVIHANLLLCYRCGWKIEGKIKA